MKKQVISLTLILSLIILNTSTFAGAEGNSSPRATCISEPAVQLMHEMQELWIEHAWWTRSLIISKLAGIEDQNEVLQRLLQNQVDIGNIIKPYYGEKTGAELTALLTEHIMIAGRIIDAAKKNDQASVDRLNKEWFKNADAIVNFLANINPNWSKEELKDIFYNHLKFITGQVVNRLNKNWKEDIRFADVNQTHLIHLGDELTKGIVKQFPEKFK